jgi:hypothetical protein
MNEPLRQIWALKCLVQFTRHDASLRTGAFSRSKRAAMSMSPMFPLYALSLPTVLIASATISLHQFKLCFVAFVRVANTSRGNAVWQAVQPMLRDIAFVMENTLGKASAFSPNLTHVLLTSLVLAVVFSAERLRAAIVATRR